MELNVRLPGHMHAGPGAYVYLTFSGLPWRYRYQAHPLMVVSCEHDVEVQDGKQQHDVTNLTFLAQPQKGLTARLYQALQADRPWKPFGKSVSFDGPYGQDLHLERYEMVVLVARGIGIAGVLPYARYLAHRQRHDGDIKMRLKLASTPNKPDLRNSLYRDATRKVDLLWVLDFNCQEEWISEQLRALQNLDPHRVSRPPSDDQANAPADYEPDLLLLPGGEGLKAADQTRRWLEMLLPGRCATQSRSSH
jgi:predicted ferric reductase